MHQGVVGRDLSLCLPSSSNNGAIKSARSRRAIDIGAATVEALRSHKTQAIEAALAHGHPYDRDGFVFSQADGKPLTMSIVYKAWLKLNAKAKVKRIRFHDLRHTCATLLLSEGVNPKVVSEQLGHASIVITLDRYAHVIPTMQREAAKMMDELLAC